MQGDEMFAQFLIDAGVVPRSVIDALARGDEPLGRALVARGILTEDEVARASARAFGIPFAALAPDSIDSRALVAIPEAFCRAHGLVAFAKEGERLEVALSDLAQMPALDALRLPYALKIRLTDRQSIKRALLRYQELLKERFALDPERASPEELVDALLARALEQGAQAVHLEPSPEQVLVRYRIGGALHDAMRLPQRGRDLAARLRSLAKIEAPPGAHAEGRFAIAQAGERIPLRVTSMPTAAGESLVVHIARQAPLSTAGLHGEALEYAHRALAERAGLILVCAPGSGAPALVDALTEQAAGQHRSVARVGNAADVSLAARMRAALRHDPDVLAVDALDAHAAALALEAANRGMLVIAALDAPSAADGMAALASVSPQTLAAVLRLTLSVQPVRRLCACRRSARPSRSDVDALEGAGANLGAVLSALKSESLLAKDAQWKDVPFFAPSGCAECAGGYAGSVWLHDIIPASMTLGDSIRRGADAEELREQARAEGVLSRAEDGVYQAVLGRTSLEEVLGALL